MSIETGRKVVDYILDLYEKNESDFVNQNTRAVVLDLRLLVFRVLPPRDSACAVHENQLCDEWQVVVFSGGAAPVRKIS